MSSRGTIVRLQTQERRRARGSALQPVGAPPALRRRHLRALYRLGHTYAIQPPAGAAARVLATLRAHGLATLLGGEHEVLGAGWSVVEGLHAGEQMQGYPAGWTRYEAVAGLRRLAP